MQCHLLLESIVKHCKNSFRVRVNYVASNSEYQAGYGRLISESRQFPLELEWHREVHLRLDFLDAIRRAKSRLFCLLTDDSVFFRTFPVERSDFLEIFKRRYLTCFSFRLGLNTVVQDYATGHMQPPLWDVEKSESQPIIYWDWRSWPMHLNYGYPISQDGHMYRSKELLQITENLDFTVFRSWEGTLAGDRRDSLPGYEMAAFDHSCLVNIPNNNVQVPPIPCGAKYPISIKELNERYLANELIDLEAMDFSNVRGAHQEIQYIFKKK